MATYAVINGDYVANVIVAASLSDAEIATGSKCVEYTETNPAGVGWKYDEKTKKFVAPPTPPAEELNFE